MGEPSPTGRVSPLEVVQRVRERVGAEFPMIYRISAEEYVASGLTLEETAPYARMLVESGINAIHVTGGVYESAAMIIQPAAIPQAVYVENATAIKMAIEGAVPVIVAGRLKDPAYMTEIVTAGKVDMISIGRTLLADPDFPAKIKAGHPEDVLKCTGCEQGCADRLFAGLDIGCLGNPLTGKEWQFDLSKKAATQKRILVVGGGPGGLEAARIATLRGHEVSLYEKSDRLGGLINYIVALPHKGEFGELMSHLIRTVEKLGVRIELNQAVDREAINRENPDLIILATGSRPIIPAIPGNDNSGVCGAEDIMSGRSFGARVAVIGGGAVGAETAELLADKGAKVTIIEMRDDLAKDVGILERALLVQRLAGKEITTVTNATVREITPDLKLVIQQGERASVLAGFDTIVMAVGYKSDTSLEEHLKSTGIKVPYVSIGDCVTPRKVIDATWEAFQQAYRI